VVTGETTTLYSGCAAGLGYAGGYLKSMCGESYGLS
jgi:hypothetical protein